MTDPDSGSTVSTFHSYQAFLKHRCPFLQKDVQALPSLEGKKNYELTLSLRTKAAALYLMEYLYTDSITFSPDLAPVLDLSLFASTRLPDLYKYIASYLVKSIQVTTVGTIAFHFKD